ncbi:hypothetical protein D3C73_1608650 [compost metagenome]
MYTALLAAFREQQMFIREQLMDLAHLIEGFADIPVEAGSPYVFGCFRIIQNGRSALHDNVAVMVPDQNVDVLQPF